MGQGAQTGLAMMLAEELEADWNSIRVVSRTSFALVSGGGAMLKRFGASKNSPTPIAKPPPNKLPTPMKVRRVHLFMVCSLA
jgi:hypothetical protein